MRIDTNNSVPTNPYHIARAYGVKNASPAAPAQSARFTGQAANTQAVQSPVVQSQGSGAQTLPSAAQRLVAAVVPGRVDFSGSTPQPGAGSGLQMYRHPADRNAAATGVMLGKSLDVSG